MALLKILTERDIEVLAICRNGSVRSENIKENDLIKKIYCSLNELKSLKIEERYDFFFHLAWSGTTGSGREDAYLQLKNIEYTLDAADLAARTGCSCFVGAGSQAEYGRVECRLSSKTPTFPESQYGIAKLCAGQTSREVCHSLGIRHNWVRILSVYGPYDTYSSMVMSTISALRIGQIPRFTDGEQIWDYLYSEDAARGLLSVAEKGKDGCVYCLGSGEERRLCDYIEKIRNAVSPSAPISIGELPYSPKQITYLLADTSELERDTGFKARVSFDEGIVKTVGWYDAEH